MKWEKKGRIFEPRGQFSWMTRYGILPTPTFREQDDYIRVFFATAANDNIGRVTYMDISADDPTQVLDEPNRVLISEGQPGLFDDCGVNPTAIVDVEELQYLYYVGYQRSLKVPYLLFPGLAIGSVKAGFKKIQRVPIIDRSTKYPYSLAAPFVMHDKGIFKMWLWLAKEWTEENTKPYLAASIGYAESHDGIEWEILKDDCIDPIGAKEFSVGRPWVIIDSGQFKMFYSVRHIGKLYRLGYAESLDGINWIRKDSEIGIDVSEKGWDSQMICYSSVITAKNRTFMFYNGNNNGEGGFGVAELIDA